MAFVFNIKLCNNFKKRRSIMPRNCPYCDMYTVDDFVCVHCGEKLPQTEKESITKKTKQYKTVSKNNHGMLSKILLSSIVIIVLALGYKFIFASKEIPAYMNEGPVYLSEMVVKGKINIFDFYSDGCGPCRQIAPYLHKLKERRPDLNIVKIDINRKGIKGIDWNSPTVKQFKIRSIPFFIVIDENGNIMKMNKDAYKYVVELIQKEAL
jgi:thiol-disulfide isomerase/thioredoxin/rRNA maturation protein Nop10